MTQLKPGDCVRVVTDSYNIVKPGDTGWVLSVRNLCPETSVLYVRFLHRESVPFFLCTDNHLWRGNTGDQLEKVDAA